MKGLIAVIAFSLMFGPAFAQTTGAPAAAQNDMNKPGMNNPDKGSMNQGTTGTSTTSSPVVMPAPPARALRLAPTIPAPQKNQVPCRRACCEPTGKNMASRRL